MSTPLLWLALAFAGDVCADLPPPERHVVYPNGWPDYPGRCLDVGPVEETLLDRARRCLQVEPEDPAPLRLVSYLGDASDVPAVEAQALDGPNGKLAVSALIRLAPDDLRERLLRIACTTRSGRALEHLAQAPRLEEAPLYAASVNHSSHAARALGTLGTTEGRRLLDGAQPHFAIEGLVMDWSDEGLAALRARWQQAKDPAEILYRLPAEHPEWSTYLSEALVEERLLTAAVDRVPDLSDPAAMLVLVAALRSPTDALRGDAAQQIGRDPSRHAWFLPQVTRDPVLAAHVHLGRRRSARDPAERQLQEDRLEQLLEHPQARWIVLEDRLRRTHDVELARRLVDDPKTPEGLRRRAERTLRYDAEEVEPPPVDPATFGESPTFSRNRTPVADAEALATEARRVFADPTTGSMGWAMAVLPWVGDDRDIDALRTAVVSGYGPWYRLADLGTEAALDAIPDRMHRGQQLWGWTRSARGWEHLVKTATEASHLQSVVRPEAYEAATRLNAPDTSTARPDPTWSVAQQRQAFQRRFRLPPRAQLDRLEQLSARQLRSMVDSPALRAELVRRLPELVDPSEVLRALVDADWRGQRPPEPVVAASRGRRDRGAFRVLVAAEELEPVLAALDHTDASTRRQALGALVQRDDPAVLDAVQQRVQSGRLDAIDVAALAMATPYHPILEQALSQPGFDRCYALRYVGRGSFDLDDATLVAILAHCERPPQLRVAPERRRRLQAMVVATPDADAVTALSLDHTDPNAVLPFLDDPDPLVRNTILEHLFRAGLTPELADVVEEWASEEPHLTAFGRTAHEVLAPPRPRERRARPRRAGGHPRRSLRRPGPPHRRHRRGLRGPHPAPPARHAPPPRDGRRLDPR